MTDPVQTPIDPVEPGLTQAEEIGSLDDFAKRYATGTPRAASEDEEGAADEPLSPQPPRAARSRPDDHETIAALTKRLRDAEAQIGVNTTREEGESDRAFNLRLRAEAAEALAKRPAERTPPAKAVPAPIVEAPKAFTEQEPTIDQFADQADPYSAWQRAVNAFDRRKERFDEQQTSITADQEERLKAAHAIREAAEHAHRQRINAFRQVTPDYDKFVGAAREWPSTPLMQVALVNDPNGEKYIYHLAQDRAAYNRLLLDSDGKVVTRETVEAFQDLLKERMPAVTGSAHTPAVVNFPPRPPNPVRTGRMRPSDGAPPNPDSMSLDDFAQKFPSKGSRRR